jgi:hypothetical protein
MAPFNFGRWFADHIGWIFGIGAAVGSVVGFQQAGIGGAIAGAIVGGIGGGYAFMFASILVAFLVHPLTLLVFALGLIATLIGLTWGVGKP